MGIIGSLFNRFFYLDDFSDDFQDTPKKYIKISAARSFTFGIVEIFLVLYLLDQLGFRLYGIILSVRFLVQALTDYPTGVLGDVFGQNKMLLAAFLSYILGIALILSFDTFQFYLLAYVIIAIASSLESGALNSWFDNEYNSLMGEFDPDRQLFGAFKSRHISGMTIVLGASFALGGIFANSVDRIRLIQFHLLLLILTTYYIWRELFPGDPISRNSDISLRSDIAIQFKSSMNFIFSNKSIFLFYLGTVIIFATSFAIWFSLILFPYYESYSKTDFLVGVQRSANFWLGTILTIYIARMSTKIKGDKLTFSLTMIIGNSIFFGIIYIYTSLFPPQTHFEVSLYIGVIILFGLAGFGDTLTETFMARIQTKIIPDKMRNSIYSLIPTLITLFGIPFAFIGGWVLNRYDILAGILLSTLIASIGSVIMLIGIKNLEITDVNKKLIDSIE